MPEQAWISDEGIQVQRTRLGLGDLKGHTACVPPENSPEPLPVALRETGLVKWLRRKGTRFLSSSLRQ